MEVLNTAMFTDGSTKEDLADGRAYCLKCGICLSSRTLGSVEGTCKLCSQCAFCGTILGAKDAQGQCANCRCHYCGVKELAVFVKLKEGIPLGIMVAKGSPPKDGWAACINCAKKNLHQFLCKSCKMFFPQIHRKGDKKPSICVNCAASGKTHYCVFCPEKAIHYRNVSIKLESGKTRTASYFTCVHCRYAHSCFEGDCTPYKQCKSCAGKESKKPKVLNEFGEFVEDDPVEDARHYVKKDGQHDMTCPGCLQFFVKRPVAFLPASLKEHRENPTTRMIGVEVEVAGTYLITARLIKAVVDKYGMSIVYDGSLPKGKDVASQSLSAGFEINTTPSSGDRFNLQIRELCGAIEKSGAFIDNSCGLHVHVDARDFSYEDLRKMMLAWYKLEPAFLETQPIARIKTNKAAQDGKVGFARICGKLYGDVSSKKMKSSKDLKRHVLETIYEGDERVFGVGTGVKGILGDHYLTYRYRSLNLHSWFKRKTIECRIHEGTINARDIISWSTLWAATVDAVLKSSEKEIANWNDPKEILLQMAPTPAVREWLRERWERFAAQYKDTRRSV